MGDTKQILRARIIRLRDSLSAFEIDSKSRLIQHKALEFFPYLRSRAVALYSPTGNEVATEKIREHARKMGKKIFYPKLARRADVRLVPLQEMEELQPGRHGILEPPGEVSLAKDDEKELVVFVPGLAFDLRGNRLGRGSGWYDRALAQLDGQVRVVALAYEFQIVDQIPTERRDRKVHHIITERRVIDCGDLPSDSGWVS